MVISSKFSTPPEIAVHADGPEIKRGDAERLRSNLAVPAIEAAKIQVRRTIPQTSRLDRMGVVHQKQEHVAVAGVKRRGLLGDVDEWVMRHRLPGEHARDLPPCIAGPVARDVNHGGDKFVIPDAAIVRAGDRAKLDASATG